MVEGNGNLRRHAAVVTLASLLSTLFLLQAMRMSVPSVIVVLDQANRNEIVRTILVGFVLILGGGVWRRALGVWRAYFGAMIAVAATLALASATRYYFVMILGERVVADLRDDLFKHLAGLDASFYDTARTGELLSRLTADTTHLKAAFGSSASVALRNLFMFLGAVVMMVATSPKLAGLVLLAIPVIVLPLILSGRGVRTRSRHAQDMLAQASAYAGESLSAVRTMPANGAQPSTVARFRQAVETAYDARRRRCCAPLSPPARS